MADPEIDASDDGQRYADFNDLNVLGKAVYAGGLATRLMVDVIDFALGRAVEIVVRSERAFRQGLEPHVEDAKVLEEIVDRKAAVESDT